jgi:thioesterase domain-containing protein
MKLPYADVEFDKTGAIVDHAQLEAVDELLAQEHPTDVVVLSHGWNNSHLDARALYERLVDSIVAVRGQVSGADQHQLVVIGVLWPSIQWAADEDSGAGAGLLDERAALEAEIAERIEDGAVRVKLLALVPHLESSSEAQEEFLELLRSTLPAKSKGEDDAAFEALKTASAQEVIDAARTTAQPDDAAPEVGGAADIDPAGLPPLADEAPGGGGAGFFDSIVNAARNLVNITTYYTMKERAGVVGKQGIAPLLEHIHAAAPDARLHIAGHSFGGRAVTAAALATKAPVSSLALLQAAYSHFGMAKDWDGTGRNGLFTKVPAKVDGPVVVTFTRNDKAVGMAYPIASRLAQQIGVSLGDENDPYGGIGRNGALKTPGSVSRTLLDVGGSYAFADHQVCSLNGDAFITGHSDVTGRQVAYAVLTAVAGT